MQSADYSNSSNEDGHTNVGLTTIEANKRLNDFGLNRLPTPPLPSPLNIFFHQFLSPFIYILAVAAIVSYLLSQIPNAVFILIVLLINALIGTIQEFSAQKSAAALRDLVKGQAVVIRDGATHTIDAEQLVPGDYILLSSGNKVPADIELLKTSNLTIDESLLTGESLNVAKNTATNNLNNDSFNENRNQCFAGSIITRGRGEGTVTATALNTQLGQIAKLVTKKRITEAPLMIRIRKFTYQVTIAIICAILLLIAIMFIRGNYSSTEIIMMIIGLAVSAIPEGLPAALTVALAIGMQRMAKHNVIIRKLVAVESLGSCTYICSDKTGTLTVNQLTIREISFPDGRNLRVSGEGVAQGGNVNCPIDAQIYQLCVTGLLANESHLDYSGGEWSADGDVVDVAFLVLAKKTGLSITQERNTYQQVNVIPYESEQAFSGSMNHANGENPVVHVKGSPEKILEMCSHMSCADLIKPIDKEIINHQFEDLAERGYRVIALARRVGTNRDDPVDNQLHDMVFLGMVAMIDPVRQEAREAVRRCLQGGIKVAMITGDHPLTARAIGRDIGLYKEDEPVVTGSMLREVAGKPSSELTHLIRGSNIFARIEPQQKEQIVSCLIQDGHLVAVTGDGVNDAPAMRISNVGIAMGKRGTDVAKETADIILTDDNFSSIVDAIEQGRIVYANIRKVIGLLIATGLSALLLFLCSVISGLQMPLTAVQLLWLNLVANGVQDVALAFEPKEGNELNHPPRNPNEPIFDKSMINHVLVTGITMGLLAFGVYFFLVFNATSIEDARNLTLLLMVLFGNIHALSSRSETQSLFTMSLVSNPILFFAVPFAQCAHIAAIYLPGISDVLALRPVSIIEWVALFGVAMIFLMVEEIHKYLKRRNMHSFKNKGRFNS